MLRRRKSPTSRPLSPPKPPALGCGLNPCRWQPPPQKGNLGFFFFYPALGCNWIQTETTTSAPGKEGIGAGAEGACGRREGPEERAREGSPSSSQTKQKKDQKTGKRGRANRRFQEQSPHLQADSALGIQIQCLRKTKGAPREWRCDPRAWAPTRSPHGPAARTVADHVSRPTTRPQSAAPPARARLKSSGGPHCLHNKIQVP